MVAGMKSLLRKIAAILRPPPPPAGQRILTRWIPV
jgi:hypothetical protein